jgi:hypothetical protein
MPAAAISPMLQPSLQQSVDGLNGTLEIPARSSYVPSLAPGVGSPAICGGSAPQCGAINVLGMPTWMK